MRRFAAIVILAAGLMTVTQSQEAPWFTKDFSPQEFAARRAKIADAIGENGVALLQGAAMPPGYTRFRQSNEFYYLCGVEVPHAYLLIYGSSKRTHLYLPHTNAGRARMEGAMLSADDPEGAATITGVDAVFGTDLLGEHLARLGWTSAASDIWTPFQPAEGASMSRDLAVRVTGDHMADPLDGRPSRTGAFLTQLRERFPMFGFKDLSPTIDRLRTIKSEGELALIRKATRLSGLAMIEGMRSAKPGVWEYEIDAAAKYIFYRNGAQGEAYYSLVASGPNALIGHYNAGRRQMEKGDLLLFDFAPDVGYYMSDLTRMIPVGGVFTPGQRELYSFYVACYTAILDAIKPGRTAQQIFAAAVPVMDKALKSRTFSKELYTRACEGFVENFRNRAARPGGSLGHWTGMATHDVGPRDMTYEPGMVFTIEPSLRVPEENINIRLEDLIIMTPTGREVVSAFVPMTVEDVERVMKEEGMVQRYPMDSGR